jgi:hypothetical protein
MAQLPRTPRLRTSQTIPALSTTFSKNPLGLTYCSPVTFSCMYLGHTPWLPQCVSHCSRSLIPHRGQIMTVGVEGHGYGGVPQEFLYQLRVNPPT